IRYLADAEQLAVDLDETLERAKIWHSQAELRIRDGDYQAAHALATAALANFTNSRTHYEVTHARLTLSRASAAGGQQRQAVQDGACARSSVESMGYGLLRHLYPQTAYDLGERVAGALMAYVCGDALGAAWEGSPRTGVSTEEIEELPAREGCSRGATTDDSA